MSKKQQAQQMYNSYINTHTRKEIIDAFCNKLNMSVAGANTYYSMCSKQNNPNMKHEVLHHKVSKQLEVESKQVNDNKLFTICFITDDIVDSTGSYYDEHDAQIYGSINKLLGLTVVLVKGLPEIGTHVSKLKQIPLK